MVEDLLMCSNREYQCAKHSGLLCSVHDGDSAIIGTHECQYRLQYLLYLAT